MKTKVCPRCKTNKPATEYHKSSAQPNGLQSWCKECQKENNRKKGNYHYQQLQKFWGSVSPGVYKIFDEVTGEVLYVGESIRPERRRGEHLYKRKDTEKAYKHSIINGMISEGILDNTNLKFEVIEYVDDADKRKERETYWINKLNPTYNSHKRRKI